MVGWCSSWNLLSLFWGERLTGKQLDMKQKSRVQTAKAEAEQEMTEVHSVDYR